MKQTALKPLAFAAIAVAMMLPCATLQAAEADDKAEDSFKKSYVYQTYLKDDAIKADAEAGVMTLTGTVADESHKTLAHEVAAGLPGIVRVDNQLATQAEADTENADKWIGRKVKLSLLFHRNVEAGKTTVEVKDGVVTLTGVASSQAQKDLTAAYAADIDNVKEVKNQMTVVKDPAPTERTDAEKIDDASVTAQVKAAMKTQRSTKDISAKVETRNGEVTLTGIAKNDAEKALVTKLVTDIRGVTGVKNQMTVQEAVQK